MLKAIVLRPDQVVAPIVVATFLIFSAFQSHAQNNPISGAIGGAAQGNYEGKKAAGPIGGIVGGALGAGVGAVTGTINGVVGTAERITDPAPNQQPATQGVDEPRR